MTMRFNLKARRVHFPGRRPSTSLPNAFRPLLDEMRECIAANLRIMARARRRHLRPRPDIDLATFLNLGEPSHASNETDR